MLFSEQEKNKYLPQSTIWLMAVGAGLVVASNYYNQPLLGMISREFEESEAATSKVAMFTQIGYALGLLFIIPLGDMLKRKRLIVSGLIFALISLVIFAFSRSLTIMITASLFIGISTVVTQMFVAISAQFSAPEAKDKNIGLVQAGLLIGVLSSRVFSGMIGEYLGWRTVFFIAAGFILILIFLLIKKLPPIEPTFRGSYSQLMYSIFKYAKLLPGLRLASLRGALGFGAFSIFWTTLTFHLEQPPFFRGSDVAGLLGLAGIFGALASSLVAYIKMSKNNIITIACCLMIAAWGMFYVSGDTYAGLIIGIILLDLGLQAMHVSNLSFVYSAYPEATNRLNTFYMTSYFIGGSAGTLCGGKAWELYGWDGVVITGATFIILCLIVHLLNNRK
ncbi:MAG: MFS transporter [Dysgonomonas sp.]